MCFKRAKYKPRLPFRLLHVMCAIVCITYPLQAYSNSPPPDSDLFYMSIEELLQQKVSVASFNAEGITWASAVVTRYDRTQMQVLGVRSIPEMLSLVPGVLVQSGHRGNQQVMVRGVIDSWNQKVLFLLDDVPYWMPSHGEIPLEGIPFNAIDHIEIIRGPGAVTHGSNATAAVIKIVTRTDDDIEISNGIASNNQRDMSAYLSDQIDDWNIQFAVQKWNTENIETLVLDTLAMPDEGLISMRRNAESIFLQVSNQSFSATMHRFDSTQTGIDGFSATNNYSETQYEGELLGLRWEHQWNALQFDLHTDYNQFLFSSDVDKIINSIGINAGSGSIEFDSDGSENYRWRSGFQIQHIYGYHTLTVGYDYEERFSITLFGLVPELFDQPLFTLIPENSMFENTAFIQSDWDLDNWRIVYGVRYLKLDAGHKDIDERWLPRLTTMYRIDEQRTMRFFYGEGYNSPSFAQKGSELSNVILPSNDSTLAERIAITEVAYQEQYNHWFWGINAFHYKTINFIQAIRIAETTNYQNAEDIERSGFELETTYIQGNFNLLANLSYLRNGGTTQRNDPAIFIAPKILANIGAAYYWREHTLGSTISYAHHQESAPSYTRLNLNYSYEIENWILSLKAQNILNRDKVTLDTRLLATMKQESDQALIVEIRYKLN